MAICPICKRFFLKKAAVLKHVKDIHKPLNVYSCVESECSRFYSTYHSLANHMRLKHPNLDNPSEPQAPLSNSQPSCLEEHCSSETSRLTNEPLLSSTDSTAGSDSDMETEDEVDWRKRVDQQIINFILNLYSHSTLTRSMIQSMIENVSHFVEVCIDSAQKEIEIVLKGNDEVIAGLDMIRQTFSNYRNLFSKYSTEYKRIKVFEESKLLVKPEQYLIGQKPGQKRVRKEMVEMPINYYGQHVPLLKTFQRFFNREGVVRTMLDYQNKLAQDETVISNFIQGSYWKKLVANDRRLLIPFFLFTDDFEVGNPLSTHSGIHKICGTYISFPTLPPEHRSKLENIFITLLFHASDRKMFGNLATFLILIDEIIKLHQDGIDVNTQEFLGTIFPIMVLVAGDNLGIHSVCGFSESFTCNFPCHVCKMSRNSLKFACVEDESVIRNEVDYEADVKLKNVSVTGIKEVCHFNRIPGWHVCNNVSFDVMHDLTKGVFNYDLVIILNHFVSEKLFSLSLLNDRLENYDFGSFDTSNRPLAISSDELAANHLRMTASEMIVFVVHLGLIIGDLVPHNDPMWKLYLSLRDLMDLIFAPSLTIESLSTLHEKVEEHNSLYLSLSKQPLKNKFHHLVHYENHIRKFGPLILLWVMRFEAKHKQAKDAANTILSRRNTCYSLSFRHQLQAMRLFNDDFVKVHLDTSPKGCWIKPCEHDVFEEFNLPVDFAEKLLYLTDWVKYQGTLYREGVVIIYDIKDAIPTCFLIQAIFVNDNDEVLFLCSDIKVLEFDSHAHAFRLDVLSSASVIKCPQNLVHAPCSVSRKPNGDKYISLRHRC